MNKLMLTLLLAAAACQPATPSPPVVEQQPVPGDSTRVQRLEAEARALADTAGCTGAGACRTAPVGERACGGPREYLVFCAATTDTVALFAKLEELRQAEAALNRETGAVSTCEFRAPPGTELVNGVCRATAAAQPVLQ